MLEAGSHHPTNSGSAQGIRRTLVQGNRWDGEFLETLSQVAHELPISQQLSWPRTPVKDQFFFGRIRPEND
jgi:hypothetical protein